MEKVIRDGKVAILYSPGFGAGWSTWNSYSNEMIFDPDIVNVNGGAVELGHPLGCTGAKLSVQIFNELRLQNKKYGLVTACVGGGQGVAGVYELLK
jgi:acetyl-CoA acetyltransferase